MVIAGFFVVETYAINVFQAGVECQETRQNFLHPKYFGVLYRTNRQPNMPPPPRTLAKHGHLTRWCTLVGVGVASYGRGAQWKNAFILRVFIACHRIYTTPRSEIMAGNMLNGMLDFCLNNSWWTFQLRSYTVLWRPSFWRSSVPFKKMLLVASGNAHHGNYSDFRILTPLEPSNQPPRLLGLKSTGWQGIKRFLLAGALLLVRRVRSL